MSAVQYPALVALTDPAKTGGCSTNAEVTKIGTWRGQDEEVLFKIKGKDVVITKQNGEFITILKNGVINSARIKNARIKEV